MTSSNGNLFRVTGPLWRESTGHWWISLTKASDAKFWCFLSSAPPQSVEQTVETMVIFDAIALIMTYDVPTMATTAITLQQAFSQWHRSFQMKAATSLAKRLASASCHIDNREPYIYILAWAPVCVLKVYHDDVIKWKHFPRFWLLCGEFTGHRWIPLTNASDSELWCFLWSVPEQTVE